jgi:hypothetical protein
MSDKVIAWLRTVVPALWGLAVAWLVTRVPAFAGLADGLNSVGGALAVPVAVALWKWVFTAAENVMPSWLTAVLLGHPAAPTYLRPVPAAPVVPPVTPISE